MAGSAPHRIVGAARRTNGRNRARFDIGDSRHLHPNLARAKMKAPLLAGCKPAMPSYPIHFVPGRGPQRELLSAAGRLIEISMQMSMRLLGCLALACVATAQTPAFEVATLKISEPITPELVQSGRLQMGVSIDSKYVRISKLSLLELVSLAYQLKSYQLTAPSWMANQRYDIQAKLPEGGARGQVPAMLQTLLAERLALKSHREPQERKVYALTVAKGGHRLKEAAPDNAPKEPPASTGQIRGGLAVAPGGAVSTLDPGGNSRMTPG